MIDSQTKQRIIESANILEVVSDFVSLKRRGASYVGLCPFHSDRKPSFYVSPSKNVCKCFACDAGGGPVQFVMKHEQLQYHDALRYLAKKYGIEIVEREETDEEREAANERQRQFIVNEYAAEFFRRQLHESQEGQHVGLTYLRERGLRLETIEKFGLGYSPESRDALTRDALAAGYTLDALTATGLSIQYEDKPAMDRFRGRVIFPVRNLSGQYVAFGGRVMSKTDKTAKYLNSPESAIYSKSRELYGLYWAKQAISRADKCYLVEGYTDVISMHQSGIENVVSSSGTALTVQQIRLIRRFTEHITVLYDGDSAGIKAALRGIDLLLEEGLDIKVVLLPEGEDPDSYAQKHRAQDFLAYLDAEETDFIHFKIRLYQEEMKRDPIKRAELIKDILRSVALIPDTIRRTVLVQSVSAELKMDEQLLASEVAKMRVQGLRSQQYSAQGQGQSPGVGTGGATATLGAHTATGSSLAASAHLGVGSSTEAVPHTSVGQDPHNPEADTAYEASPTSAYEPYRHELALLGLIMQHGAEEILPERLSALEGDDPEETPQVCTLASYIRQEVEYDSMTEDLSPVCRDVLWEATDYCLPRGLETASFFMNHDSEAIRLICTDLLAQELQHHTSMEEQTDYRIENFNTKLEAAQDEAEREAILADMQTYQEEKRVKEMKALAKMVNRELDQIRMAIILKSIAEIQKKIVLAERAGDSAGLVLLIQQLQEDNAIKQELAQALGERTIKA